jgi:hypothetical protein
MVKIQHLDKILDRALGRQSIWRDVDPGLGARAAHDERVVRVARELHSLGRRDLAAQLLDDAVGQTRQSDFPPAA